MFKDLQKLVQCSEQERNSTINTELDRLQKKPFWIWNIEEHKQEAIINTNGYCCFNHIIGLPTKEGE